MHLSYLDESGDDGVFDPNQQHGSSQFMVYANVFLKLVVFGKFTSKCCKLEEEIKSKVRRNYNSRTYNLKTIKTK
jgi:hypothetical protein